MNERRQQREAIGLTQAAAAARAGVSLATWRRWEEDPDVVSVSTRTKCGRVLGEAQAINERDRQELRDQLENIERQWKDHPLLTPRQAAAIQTQIDMFQDMIRNLWLNPVPGQTDPPLHTIPPFESLDPRVMIYVNDNKTWAHLARTRCIAVRDEMDCGILPFDRDGCFFDEVLMAIAINWAADDYDGSVTDGLFDGIALHANDGSWAAVFVAFMNEARWGEWFIPTCVNHELLPDLLVRRHPFTWFDGQPGPVAALGAALPFQSATSRN